MVITVYDGEKRIGSIAEKVFGNLNAADTKRATSALLRANPHLEDLSNVSKGAVLVVPTVPGLAPKQQPVAGTAQTVLESVLAAAKQLQVDLEARAQDQSARCKQDLDVISTVKDPDLKPEVDRVKQATQSRMNDAQTNARAAAVVAGKVAESLKELMRRLP